ncbi:MAG: SDR family oxidoreductase [Alphaproteobacteria bacterium]|nr:SDR family oxidoreductase [Alphaproteobacteria bacterium]
MSAPSSRAGKLALVTGASRGIGRATAIALARRGAAVALAARYADGCTGTAAAIREGGGTAASLHAANLADTRAATALGEDIIARHGRLDILANNAGLSTLGTVDAVTPSELARVLAVNVTAPWALMRAVLPGMKARGAGIVINLCSSRAHIPGKGCGACCASKAWLLRLTQCLHQEIVGSGVQVFAFSPGLTLTDMVRDIYDRADAPMALPLEAVPPPERAAQVIGWLAGGEAGDLAGLDIAIQFNDVTRRAGLETGEGEPSWC